VYTLPDSKNPLKGVVRRQTRESGLLSHLFGLFSESEKNIRRYFCKKMNGNRLSERYIRIMHYYSGMTLASFISLHLLNHVMALGGLQRHMDVMHLLRMVYRNPVAESLLLLAVAVQVFSGLKLFARLKKNPGHGFAKLQIWSGLYLSFFFLFHVSAVLYGRTIQHLDTNIYYGIAGLNTFPYLLFFVPYYAFAIMAFFAHIAAVHVQKMRRPILGSLPRKQSMVILMIGIAFTLIILYTLTNGFKGYIMPKAYQLKSISRINEKPDSRH
jgi:hypothetical protein